MFYCGAMATMDQPRAGTHYPRSVGEFHAWFGSDRSEAAGACNLARRGAGGRGRAFVAKLTDDLRVLSERGRPEQDFERFERAVQ